MANQQDTSQSSKPDDTGLWSGVALGLAVNGIILALWLVFAISIDGQNGTDKIYPILGCILWLGFTVLAMLQGALGWSLVLSWAPLIGIGLLIMLTPILPG
jgi:hypothetical protein